MCGKKSHNECWASKQGKKVRGVYFEEIFGKYSDEDFHSEMFKKEIYFILAPSKTKFKTIRVGYVYI